MMVYKVLLIPDYECECVYIFLCFLIVKNNMILLNIIDNIILVNDSIQQIYIICKD